MDILPPRISGPLSECNRSVSFQNAIPGATVYLLRTRNGQTDRVGDTQAKQSTGVVSLYAGEEFAGGDLVSAYQESDGTASPPQPDSIEVQKSEAKFHPPQVLTHLYQCSRGFQLGAMRPGTTVQVLQGNTMIASGEATDGTAFVKTDDFGLPAAGTVLTVRQLVCPKPPPPPPSTAWAFDSSLPAVESLPTAVPQGGTLPAPTIVSGLSECSRSIQVRDIIPGAEVFIEDTDHAWWAWLGPSDATTGTVILPTMLRDGEKVEIRQEVGQRCEMHPERKVLPVGPRETLSKPQLWQIDCNTAPVVYIQVLKQEADLEYEVVYQGETKYYRSVATASVGEFPAPPMPAGSVVRVRQGECDHWSDWSDPQTAKALAEPAQTPEIIGNLFDCQNLVPVKNIYPLAGIVRVVSDVTGTLAQVPVTGMFMSIPVAPSLVQDHNITVEHEVCGIRAGSPSKRVLPQAGPTFGDIRGPIYDGDTSVTVEQVTTGAYIELWDQTHRITSGYAPFNDTGVVNVVFSGLPPLKGDQHIYAKFQQCGHYGRNEGKTVQFRKPVLSQLDPASVQVGSGPFNLTARGSNFRQSAQINLAGVGFVATTFVSDKELRASLPASIAASARNIAVFVRNPDGQVTDTLSFTVKPAPSTTPTPPAQGYSKLQLYNCNTEWHAVHIYKRDATLNTGWQFVQTMNHQYNDAGSCPAPGSPPLEITLVDGHVNHFVVIDDDLIGCGGTGGTPSTADPDDMDAACRRHEFALTGSAGGQPFVDFLS